MFRELTITGTAASLLWGYRPAVVLTAWRITRHEGTWVLTGTVGTVDRFQARQTPLLFTAPRPGGFWAWGVETVEIGETSLRARLGPPEQ